MHTSPRPAGIDTVTDSPPAPATFGVAALVLAAGASSRLGAGRSKQLLRYQGRTLLRHSVEQALASSCRPVIVVLGADAERCQRELDGLDVHVTLNPAWAEGMGSSIRAGMTALAAAAPDARAVVITLCDQPLVTATFIDRLAQRYVAEVGDRDCRDVPDAPAVRERQADAGADADVAAALTVAAEYDGRPGVPALFPRARFAELSRLEGAAGARRLLRGSSAPPGASGAAVQAAPASSRVVTLPCPEAAVDVDTITDYEALPQ
jgi:molybdenum cofactor cytidylyltransferase